MSINQWIFSGILGQDSEIRQTENNKVLSFSVAIDESYKDKQGNKVEKTSWIKCAKFMKADRSSKITEALIKGSKVTIIGKPNATYYNEKAYQECIVDKIDIQFVPKVPF